MLFTPFILLLFLGIASALKGSIDFSKDAVKIVDPARASLLLLDKEDKSRRVFHFRENGDFYLPQLSKGKYELLIQSLDFKLSTGPSYKITVLNSTHYIVEDAQTGKELEDGLEFSADKVVLRNFIDNDSSGSFLNSLPFVPLIRKYPLMGMLLLGCIALMVSPMIISKFDPDFNEKLIQAQQDTKAHQS